MQKLWQAYKWIPQTILGSAVFAAGFAFFLQPNDLSPGGISGLALIFSELLGFGSVGLYTVLMNLPLFLRKTGKSLTGMRLWQKIWLRENMRIRMRSVIPQLLSARTIISTVSVLRESRIRNFPMKRAEISPKTSIMNSWLSGRTTIICSII